jgi:hypothetical protein
LFADGPGASEVLAALPLQDGYETRFRNLDLQTQKERVMVARVVGIETVTVPAGTFETWKVDIRSAEGDADRRTVWVARKSRKVVRVEAILPQAGGAQLSAELLP